MKTQMQMIIRHLIFHFTENLSKDFRLRSQKKLKEYRITEKQNHVLSHAFLNWNNENSTSSGHSGVSTACSSGHGTTAEFPQQSQQITYSTVLAQQQFPSRKQAIALNVVEDVSTFEYTLAVGRQIGPKNIRYASKISNIRINIYLSSVESVENYMSSFGSIRSAYQIIPANNVACFKCKETGHIASKCPLKTITAEISNQVQESMTSETSESQSISHQNINKDENPRLKRTISETLTPSPGINTAEKTFVIPNKSSNKQKIEKLVDKTKSLNDLLNGRIHIQKTAKKAARRTVAIEREKADLDLFTQREKATDDEIYKIAKLRHINSKDVRTTEYIKNKKRS
ncbi:hypothetical protein WA026_002057 [Henosepilachna vigintioctopunctata]|uniref:CCHC-type domain-containing protein n=1 Tax=Henosepilachna vigintioctopunctata TaxID=420089 RepID=A0AAW1UWA1_9CUCU